MRYIEIAEPGGPEVLRLATGPVPQPGAGEVLVRIEAAGVNRADLLQRQGHYPPPPGASPVLGMEVSGHIAEIGAGTSWPLASGRPGLRPARRRRLCRVLRGARRPVHGRARRCFDSRRGSHSRGCDHRVGQSFRAAPALSRQPLPGAGRLERDWHYGHPDGPRVWRPGRHHCRHRTKNAVFASVSAPKSPSTTAPRTGRPSWPGGPSRTASMHPGHDRRRLLPQAYRPARHRRPAGAHRHSPTAARSRPTCAP